MRKINSNTAIIVAKRPFQKLFCTGKNQYALQTRDRFESAYLSNVSRDIATIVFGEVLSYTDYYRKMSGSARRNVQRQINKIVKRGRRYTPSTYAELKLKMCRIFYNEDKLAYALRWLAQHDPMRILEDECTRWLFSLK